MGMGPETEKRNDNPDTTSKDYENIRELISIDHNTQLKHSISMLEVISNSFERHLFMDSRSTCQDRAIHY